MSLRRIVDAGLLASIIFMAVTFVFSIALSQLALGLAVFFWLIKLMIDYRPSLLITPISVVFLIWVAVGLLTALLGVDTRGSLLALKAEWLFLSFFVVWGGLGSIRAWKLVVSAIAVASIAASGYAIWQHFTGLDLVHARMLTEMASGYRAHGTFGNSLTSGGVFALAGVFLMPLCLGERGVRSLFLAAASSLVLLASLLSYSRSTLLAIVVGVLVFLILQVRAYRWRVLIGPLTLLLLVAVVEPDALLRFKREDINSRESDSVIEKGTSRFEIWATAWNMYLDNPIHGVGQHNFLWRYERYAPERAIQRYAAAHNDLLMVAATMGSIGLVAYLLIWLALLRGLGGAYLHGLSPTVRTVAATGLILIATYLVMSQFEAFLEDEEVKLAILFLLGMVFSRMNLQS